MSGRDLLIEDFPDDLLQWLRAEAVRCRQTVSELVIDILETHRFWNAKHDNQNEAAKIHGNGSAEPRGKITVTTPREAGRPA